MAKIIPSTPIRGSEPPKSASKNLAMLQALLKGAKKGKAAAC